MKAPQTTAAIDALGRRRCNGIEIASTALIEKAPPPSPLCEWRWLAVGLVELVGWRLVGWLGWLVGWAGWAGWLVSDWLVGLDHLASRRAARLASENARARPCAREFFEAREQDELGNISAKMLMRRPLRFRAAAAAPAAVSRGFWRSRAGRWDLAPCASAARKVSKGA